MFFRPCNGLQNPHRCWERGLLLPVCSSWCNTLHKHECLYLPNTYITIQFLLAIFRLWEFLVSYTQGWIWRRAVLAAGQGLSQLGVLHTYSVINIKWCTWWQTLFWYMKLRLPIINYWYVACGISAVQLVDCLLLDS